MINVLFSDKRYDIFTNHLVQIVWKVQLQKFYDFKKCCSGFICVKNIISKSWVANHANDITTFQTTPFANVVRLDGCLRMELRITDTEQTTQFLLDSPTFRLVLKRKSSFAFLEWSLESTALGHYFEANGLCSIKCLWYWWLWNYSNWKSNTTRWLYMQSRNLGHK